jgi:hypothetical protein
MIKHVSDGVKHPGFIVGAVVWVNSNYGVDLWKLLGEFQRRSAGGDVDTDNHKSVNAQRQCM